MRGPRSGWPLTLALALFVAGPGLAWLASPASAYGEHVLGANTVIGPGDPYYSVYRAQTVAQSFSVAASSSLVNVSLRIRNVGNNANTLLVALRANDPARNLPSTTVLASQSIVSPVNALVNYNIPFTPSPALYEGVSYWLVASNDAAQADKGYEWHSSDADTYPGGTGAIYNATTATWSTLFTDLWFVTSGRDLSATLSPAMTASRLRANPQDLVNFTVYFNNTGTEDARTVWVNETFPTGFTYVSDTAGSATPRSSTPFPGYTFANVSNGIHGFQVTARVDVGVAPGTQLTNSVSLAYANATGVVRSGLTAQASVLVGLATKQLYLGQSSSLPRPLTTAQPTNAAPSTVTVSQGQSADFALSPPLALAFRGLNLTATLWANTQSQNVQPMAINVYLMDANGTVVASRSVALSMGVPSGYQTLAFAFAPFDHGFPAGHRIQFRVNNDGSSKDKLVLAFNGTSTPSRIDLETTTYVSIAGIALLDAAGPATIWTPKDVLVVEANLSDPLGAAKIAGAWFDITSPTDSTSSTYVTNPSRTDPSAVPAWRTYNMTYPGALVDGTYRILVTGVEDNGVVDLAEASAEVRAPAFGLVKSASVDRVRAGDLFAYDLWFNNTGTGPGSVWINDTLPAEVNFLSFASSVAANFTGAYNWTWSGLGPGAYLLEIDVAVSGSANQVGYLRNLATLAFADEKGHSWGTVTATADVVLNGPVLGLSVSSTPASVIRSNETVVYRIDLTNAGDDAGTWWLNNTMPSGFSYLSDTASTYGGTTTVLGDEILFAFSGMPAGAMWSVDLTLRAPASLSVGAALTDLLSLESTSVNGVPMPPRSASVTLTAVAPLLTNAFVDITPVQAGGGDVLPAAVVFTNTGNEPARSVLVNLTLDAKLAFVNASVTPSLQGANLLFPVGTVAPGTFRISINFEVSPDAADRYVAAVSGTIAYWDGADRPMPPAVLIGDSVTVSAPAIALSVAPGTGIVEAGTSLMYRIYLYNGGTGTAGNVWLNLTLPPALGYFTDTSGTSPSAVGANLTWHWASQAPGPRSFNLFLLAKADAADGTAANLTFRLEYRDWNGNAKPGVSATVRAAFIAPQIALILSTDADSVFPGSALTYHMAIRNGGSTVARWVNVTDHLDERLEMLSWEAAVPITGTRDLSWNLTDLDPGEVEYINLTVRVRDGVPARTSITNHLEAVYSNSLGSMPLGYVRSLPLIVAVAVDVLPLLWILLAGIVAAPVLAVLVARRQRVTIEEVFLVYRDGVLISHLSRTLVQEKDEDVLSGMLTAVQEFVRDAFRYGEHRELHQMDFGDYRILIEQGRLAYLAVVYSGRDGSAIRKKIRGVLDRIETTYAAVLEKWDGDMDGVVGVRDLIRECLLGSGRRSKGPVSD